MPTADEIIEFNANNKKKGWCRLGFPFWFLDNSLFQSILKESFRLSVKLFIRSDSVVYSFFSAKKRGYDIIIDWVETPVAANLSRAERELKNDPFSTFFSSISESGREKLSFFLSESECLCNRPLPSFPQIINICHTRIWRS